jgi:imidazole glycerol phosphate synthase glutamine amidotransferase subunit
MIDLITYGGNIGSICRCLDRLGADYRLVSSGEEMSEGNPIVLPGVGQFGAAMRSLEKSGAAEKIKKAISAGIPFLGICVGMQVLFERSEESPEVEGLSIIEGDVVKFKTNKVPQIGWNRVTPRSDASYEPGYAYFVNSYYGVPKDQSVILYESDYAGLFCAAVKWKNVTAYQFHPEKSLGFGQDLIRRWVDAL